MKNKINMKLLKQNMINGMIALTALSIMLSGCNNADSNNNEIAAHLAMQSCPGTEEMACVPGVINFNMGPWSTHPEHIVASIRPFLMSRYEVSYELWKEVCDWSRTRTLDPYTFVDSGSMGYGAGADNRHPVTRVSWRDCIAWCNARSEMEGLTPVYYNAGQSHTAANVYRNSESGGDIANADVEWSANGYRLPTEAEWEYAARYIDGRGFTIDEAPSGWADDNPANSTVDDTELDVVSWYSANAGNATHEVGIKSPNALGIYDMCGNVWEICWDWHGIYTTASPYTDADTRGPESGTSKICRGGSFVNANTTVSGRGQTVSTTFVIHYIGFRVVRIF